MQYIEEVILSKQEYVEQVEQNRKNSLQVLPTKYKRSQSIVIATKTGKIILYQPLFGYVHGDIKYKQLNEILCIDIAGMGKNFRDRIFFSDAYSMFCINKEGQQLFKERTGSNSQSQKIIVEENTVWSLTDENLKEFQMLKSEKYNDQGQKTKLLNNGNIITSAQINDFTVIYPSKFAGYEVVIVSDDNQMKTVRNSQVTKTYSFQAAPILVKPEVRGNWLKKPHFYEGVVVGLSNNKIMLQKCQDTAIVNKWQVQLFNKQQKLANFKLFDIKNNGKQQLLATFEGGDYEYYEQNAEDVFIPISSGSLKEDVYDIEAGEINSVGIKEFVVSTAQGKILGLRPEKICSYKTKEQIEQAQSQKLKSVQNGLEQLESQMQKQASLQQQSQQQELQSQQQQQQQQQVKQQEVQQPVQQPQKEPDSISKEPAIKKKGKKLVKLDKEEESLEKRPINLEKQQSEDVLDTNNTSSKNNIQHTKQKTLIELKTQASLVLSDKGSKAQEKLKNQDEEPQKEPEKLSYEIKKFILLNKIEVQGNGSISIKIESSKCIRYIFMTSTVTDIQFIHPSNKKYKFSQNKDVQNSQLHCSYTIDVDNITEFQIQCKIVEGNRGDFLIYVISHEQPDLCQTFKFYLKPLFMHKPTTASMIMYDTDWCNQLTITGQIKITDLKLWLQQLIDYQEMGNMENFDIWFDNELLSSYLQISFSQTKGCLEFKSDSISTINIIRQLIMDDSNKRGIQIDIKHEIHPKSIKKSLKILRAKIREQRKIIEQQKILIAIKDIVNQEKNMEFLSSSEKLILNNEHQINYAVEECQNEMVYLKNNIMQIYINKAKICNQYNYQSNLEKLEKLLDGYKYKQIYELLTKE